MKALRELSTPRLRMASLNALLAGKQDVCTAVADELERRLKAITGDQCPECASKNVLSNREEGECQACGHHWYNDELA